MLTTFEGKLSKWAVDPKDNTVAICEVRLQICKANILDLYSIAGQPAEFTIHTSQMELPFKRDGRQMGLGEAPVVGDGSTAEVVYYACPICHVLRATEDGLLCTVCADKLLENPFSDLDPLQEQLEAENDARQAAEDRELEEKLERAAAENDGLIDFERLPGPD